MSESVQGLEMALRRRRAVFMLREALSGLLQLDPESRVAVRVCPECRDRVIDDLALTRHRPTLCVVAEALAYSAGLE